MTLTLPSIHLNGTSREMLREDYMKAYDALIEFRDALQSIEFNARDYYVQGPDAFTRARAERDTQFQRTGELMAYLEAHLMHIGS